MKIIDRIRLRLSCGIVNLENINYEKCEHNQIFKPGCYFAAYGKITIGKGT